MPFGSTPKDASGVPIAEVYVPGTANSDLTALEGIAVNTDGNLQKSAAARFGMKDGDNVTFGAQADAAITDATQTTKTHMAFLKGMVKIFADVWDSVNHRIKVDGSGVTQPVSGTFWQATQPVSGSVSVSNLPGTQPVSGTVSVNALPAGSAVIGHVINDAGSAQIGHVVADNPAYTQVYQTTQTGVSSWTGSGDITNLHLYSQVQVNINISAITGTSITFTVKRKDSFGNYATLGGTTALSAVGAAILDVGPGLSTNRMPGDILQITATFTGITSITFTVDVEAR